MRRAAFTQLGSSQQISTHLTPPHLLVESGERYSIVFNLLGMERKDIGIDVDTRSREVTVMAKKRTASLRRGFYWVFSAPLGARLGLMTVRFEGGVLEIVIPKSAAAIVS